MEAGTICETGETDENAVVEQIEFLTGLPPFSLYLEKEDFDAGSNTGAIYSSMELSNRSWGH